MKQKEKNRKSREHILEYAFQEFAKQGYQGASVNTICAAGKISKGLLYHYYPDKDALYLACVEKCYEDLTCALRDSLDVQPSKAIVRLAIPATLALLAKAVYNLVDTAYIGMLDSDIALTAVGVTVPLLLIMVSLLISQMALYPAFGLCYMMTITYQTIGETRYGLFLSVIRQGLFYVPFILVLPRLLGVFGIYASQPAADLLTILVCILSIPSMKRIGSVALQ